MKLFGNKHHADHLEKKRLSGVQRGLILLACSLMLLAGSMAALYFSFVKPMQIEHPQLSEEVSGEDVFIPPTVVEVQTHVNEQGQQTTVEVERPASHKEGFYNILIVGTDDDGTRTDTIMIARMDVKEHTVALLSVPRDTVITGNYTVPKINGVYGSAGKGEKGIQSLQTKLAQLLGFEVDGYAMVNLNAFVELVDLVGGVEFDVPMDMHYDDPTQDLYIHLNAGLQHLDGQQAMQLVRFRKGYATQDIERTHTQQLFLQALAEKCLKEISLANIGQMSEIFMDNVTTNMTVGNIAYFGQELLKCDFENMFTYTLEGEAVMIGDASCYAIYLNKTLDVVNEYFNPYDTQITAANVSIRTPEAVRAEQALLRAEEEPEPEELPEEEPQEETAEEEEVPVEEEDPFAEFVEEEPQEPAEGELPTDSWVTEEEKDFWRP